MRSAVNNPFMPGSDHVPAVWAGRVNQLSEWRNIIRPRLLAGLPERGRTIVGEPGLGKSTLVRRIAEEAAAAGDWVTPQLRIPAGTDSLKAVASALLRLADEAGLNAARDRRLRAMLDAVRSVSISGITLTIERTKGPEPYAALTDLLVEIGREAIRANVAVLVHIDEIQNITDDGALSQLLIALGDAITTQETVEVPGGVQLERTLPIAVYLTGLPEFKERATSRAGATFARRFGTTTLGPIDDDALMLALSEFMNPGWRVTLPDGRFSRVLMRQDAAERIVELCHGEPFLFQLAGERAWYAGRGEVIILEDVNAGWAAAASEAAEHVERVIVRLPAKEQELIRVMARIDPARRTATAIAREMGYTSASNIGPFAQRLDTVRGIISRGTNYSFTHRAIEAMLTTGWPNA